MQIPGEMLLVCPVITNRIAYIARFMATRTGIHIKIISTGEFTTRSPDVNRIILHYDRGIIPGAFNLFSSGLLAETGIRSQEPGFLRHNNQAFLYPAPDGFDLPFDILSATFFLLTRYEEYLPFTPDRHGRFEANQSLAWQHGFLEEPVIDQWLELFKSALQLKFPDLRFSMQHFNYISTIDIDNPWAYLHKGFRRTAGGILKAFLDSQTKDCRLRLDVLAGRKPDPYDTFEFIGRMEEKHHFSSLFFFLCGNYGGYDTNYALNTASFKKLVGQLGQCRSLGIHPSYRSHQNYDLLQSEYRRFSLLLGYETHISRQHYLLLSLPDTYRKLISLGIREDYSMGYASSVGFRAGTTRPFRFYDMKDESETKLDVIPFAVMDVTLRQYLSLSPDKAMDMIIRLMDKVRVVGGTFTSLWHNESLSETGVWQGWRQVFEGMVKRVMSNE
jgi:hypothetical protein